MSMTLAQRLVAAARHARIAMEHDMCIPALAAGHNAPMDGVCSQRHRCMAFNHGSVASAIITTCNAPWAKYALGADAVYVEGKMPPDLRAEITAAGGRIWSLSDLDHQIKA